MGYSCKLTLWPLEDFNEIVKRVIFKLNLVIDDRVVPCDIALIRMAPDLTDDKSTLV